MALADVAAAAVVAVCRAGTDGLCNERHLATDCTRMACAGPTVPLPQHFFPMHPPLEPCRLGTFAWLALAIALVETLVCIKFGKGCVLLRECLGTSFHTSPCVWNVACAGKQPCAIHASTAPSWYCRLNSKHAASPAHAPHPAGCSRSRGRERWCWPGAWQARCLQWCLASGAGGTTCLANAARRCGGRSGSNRSDACF